ncbi:hypothetical protein ACVADT_001641 [Escherichia coli]
MMKTNILSELRLSIESPLAVPGALNYRPNSWPPLHDWPVVIDAMGKVVSRWGDAIWRLDPWAGKALTLNFGDGPIKKHAAEINHDNANLLRIVTGWWLYGPNSSRGHRSLKTRFDQIRRIFVLCTQQGILASDLRKYPEIAELLANRLQLSRTKELMALLYELYERREDLGFILLDRKGLARLAAAIPAHQTLQTPYIPPRIWNYQITRLRACLDDFISHRKQIEECFRFCLAAYEHNTNSLRGRSRPNSFYPFQSLSNEVNGKMTGNRYYGPFIDTAHRFGIVELLNRWIDVSIDDIRVQTLSQYLKLVSYAGLGYLLNFSLMRVEEGWNLCSDCLHIEPDPRFGDFYLLKGQTTKTLSDAEALWVTSPSVSVAVEALQTIANLKADCGFSKGMVREQGKITGRYLFDYMFEPWGTQFSKRNPINRPSIPSYSRVLYLFKKLLDPEHLRIQAEDYRLARLVTPALSDEFSVGKIWPLAWHQLRRTGAVNMQASGLVSDASLQFQLKHVAKAMSLYYGQNHSRIRLEEKAHDYYIHTMYETLGRQLQQLTCERFISPHGEKRKSDIVRLISADDARKVINLSRKGVVAHRPVLLGVCTSRTPCPYGGIDNIARCGGGDSLSEPKPCADVLFDPEQLHEVELLEAILDERLAFADAGSPLKASLEAQKRSVENYRRVICKK